MSAPSSDLPELAKSLAREGKIIEAVKIIREQTGTGLAEARDLVNAYLQRSVGAGSSAVSRGVQEGRSIPPRAMQLLDEGSAMEAIKVTREELGVDLKSAKEMVDLYRGRNPQLRWRPVGSLSRLFMEWVTSSQGFALIVLIGLALVVVRLQGKS